MLILISLAILKVQFGPFVSSMRDNMRLLLAFIVLIPSVLWATPDLLNISPHRAADESIQDVLGRVKLDNVGRETPINKKVPINQIDFSLAPKVVTYAELLQMFYVIRDARFLYEQTKPQFARRISWLYPDDGCFFRAAMSSVKLEDDHLIRPAKIFAFGNLMISTPYSSAGAVYWWYHVAGVVNYMGSFYVLDPALNSASPILVDDWYSMMGSSNNVQGVVCNAYTYAPYDECYKANNVSDKRARKDQAEFLKREWDRLNSLGYEPLEMLGDNPPWS